MNSGGHDALNAERRRLPMVRIDKDTYSAYARGTKYIGNAYPLLDLTAFGAGFPRLRAVPECQPNLRVFPGGSALALSFPSTTVNVRKAR
jgi:hypothetical protein